MIPLAAKQRPIARIDTSPKCLNSYPYCLQIECLSQHWFASLSHMRSVIDNWREDYNHRRPRSALGYTPPAQFAAECRQRVGGIQQENNQL